MWAAGNTIFIHCVVRSFHGKFYPEGNKSFMESNLLEKRFIDFNRIKGGIAKKSLWLNQRMFFEKINQNRKQRF